MAFDAAMMAAVAHELDTLLAGSRIEKVLQPEKDEIVLMFRVPGRETCRLSISAGANNPKLGITSAVKENPAVPPMFCMLLRKHLSGSRLLSVRQLDFERAVELTFEAYDELGFVCSKSIIAEIMGKYSNIIFCDKDRRIISPIKTVDFTTSQKRQVLPGMMYEMPPPQDKKNPLEETRAGFLAECSRLPDDIDDKFITSTYLGLSRLTAQEIIHRGGGNIERLADAFMSVMGDIKGKRFTPVLLRDSEGKPLEYSFMPITQYGRNSGVENVTCGSFGELLDEYFGARDRIDRIRQRSADILHLLNSIEARIKKKRSLQHADLKNCEKKDELRRAGDLITANLYRIKKGAGKAKLTDYYSEDLREIEVTLDSRITPAQNAQLYYKKYAKAKTAETILRQQLKLSAAELEYIETVFDALTRAESEADLNEIRRELYEAGYASKSRSLNMTQQKKQTSKPLELLTDGGYRLWCGKNNIQNDHVTFKLADKNDWWFHVKGRPGSHVVMECDGEEPPELDFTQAAIVAATYSADAEGVNVPVDYTLVKNVKKPPASKPGYVTYSTNWTAYVTPDKALVDRLAAQAKETR